MQLTNIARDVIEDKKRNRFYINHDFRSIKETIEISENLYSDSFESIKDIPIYNRFAILVARRVYRQIGREILKKEILINTIFLEKFMCLNYKNVFKLF
jgi:Phytoene/squalene synthetase